MPAQEIKCTGCGKWEPMPREFRHLHPEDLAYLEDDYLCEECWAIRETDHAYRNGMAEMNGSGYGETI